MKKPAKFQIDYAAVYPGVEISDEVLSVLKRSDRKMKYMEYDLKKGRPIKDENGTTITYLPGREDSIERLLESGHQFVDESADPAVIFEKKSEAELVWHCLNLLDEEERSLLKAVYFEGATERKYAEISGMSKTTVNRLRRQALSKMEESFQIQNY